MASVSTVQNSVFVGNRFGDEPVEPTSVYTPEITNEPPAPPPRPSPPVYTTQRPLPVYTTTTTQAPSPPPLPSVYRPVAPPPPQRPSSAQPVPLPANPPTFRPVIETQYTTRKVVRSSFCD